MPDQGFAIKGVVMNPVKIVGKRQLLVEQRSWPRESRSTCQRGHVKASSLGGTYPEEPARYNFLAPYLDEYYLTYVSNPNNERNSMVATLTSKGQLTLPKTIRTQLDLHPGDRLDFVIRENGIVEVVPLKQPASKLRGILPKPAKPVSLDQMNEAIAKGAAS